MNLTSHIIELFPKTSFKISRGVKKSVHNVFVKIEDKGCIGYGEGSLNPYYEKSPKFALKKLEGIKKYLSNKILSSPADIQKIWSEGWQYLNPSRACQCAIDMALWDLFGKQKKDSVSKIIWGENPKQLISACTLGIIEPEYLENQINKLRHAPIIKIKMDNQLDFELIQKIKSECNAKIWVDANCSWDGLDIKQLTKKLIDFGVELLEQPLTPENNNQMKSIVFDSPIPIFADESCVEISDVNELVKYFSGINLKLSKCGGLTPGLELLEAGKKNGLKIMVGCMLESNLGIAAGAVLAQRADFIDLDGSWLLKDKVFEGVEFNDGRLKILSKDGLGVLPEESFLM